MKWGCKHEWQVVNEVTLPSGYEQLVASGASVKEVHGDMFTKTHAVILSCKHCGQLHREKTKS